jgi:hypothetical protein
LGLSFNCKKIQTGWKGWKGWFLGDRPGFLLAAGALAGTLFHDCSSMAEAGGLPQSRKEEVSKVSEQERHPFYPVHPV